MNTAIIETNDMSGMIEISEMVEMGEITEVEPEDIPMSITSSVWWSFFWRINIMGLGLGMAGGFTTGFIKGFTGHALVVDTEKGIHNILLYGGLLFFGIWAIRRVVHMHHKGYSFNTAIVNYKFALSAWWSYMWRGVGVVTLLMVFANYCLKALNAPEWTSTITILLFTFIVGFWAFNRALNVKHYGNKLTLNTHN